MGSASSKGRGTQARVALELGDLPQYLVPHVYGSSSPIDSSPSALDSSNSLAMEARGAAWELSLALPSTCGGVYYKFVLIAREPSADAVVAEECPYRIFNPLESSQIKSLAVFKLPQGKLCNATVVISSSPTSEADHLDESPSSDSYLADKAESPRERKSSKKHILEVFSNRSVSIKDLVLLGSETQVNVGEPIAQTSCPDESAVAKEEPVTPRFEDHQGLFVERNSPKLIRNCSDVSLVNGGRVLDDEPEDMPEAAGAVAAAAVSERMLLPKERRQLAIVLVGLPARGKTFTAVKLTRYLRWLGHDTKHFNVGKYRRLKHGSTQSADFFRGDNQEGVDARNEVAVLAMEDMLSWMEEGGQIGVFDATNTTKERRNMILRMAEGKCKVIFLETICNDQSIIDRNIILKIQQSPDYADQTDMKAALEDFKARLANYEKVYEPVDQGSYIKMIDTVTGEGGQIQVNGISGYLPGRVVFFLVNTHITPRPVFLTRHGESTYNLTGQIGGDPGLSAAGEAYALKLSEFINKQLKLESTASIWTSTLQRTILTARHVVRFPKVQWRALDEINAGICDGMTYEEIKDKMPDEYAARKADKLRYRYPRGESYLDVIQRLEPVIIELERQRAPVVVIAHQAVLRSLYAYFADKPLKEIPHIEFPLHTIIEIQMGVTGIQEQRHRLIEN